MSTGRLLKDEIIFGGGLDTDSDEKFVSQGDYVDALNISKFYDGSGGVLTNTSGNSEISNAYLPSGTNKCIGWCDDEENNAIIFFNYNSNNNHGIYRLLKDTDTFQKILHNKSVLAFDAETTNLQAYVIGGILYWNEGKDLDGNFINNPRKLNILKAYRYTNSLSGDKYSTIDEYVLSVIKPPYLGYLAINFARDETFASSSVSNFVGREYYRFAIQHIFDDNEVSVLGSYSNVTEYFNKDNNYIAVRFKYNSYSGTVKKLRFYFTKNFLDVPILASEEDLSDIQYIYDSNDDSTVSSLTSGNYYVYRYYGDAVGTVYSGNSNIFDNVPTHANSLCITDNRLMYGDCDFSIDVDRQEYPGIFIPSYGQRPSYYDTTAFSSTTASLVGSRLEIIIINILPTITDFVDPNSTHLIHIIWKGYIGITGSSNGYTAMHLNIDAKGICPYWSRDRIVEYIEANSSVYAVDAGATQYPGSFEDSGISSYTMSARISDDGSFSGGLTVVKNIMKFDRPHNLLYKSFSKRNFAFVYFDKYGRTLGYEKMANTVYVEDRGNLWGSALTTVPFEAVGITEFYLAGVSLALYPDSEYVSLVQSDNLTFLDVWQFQNPTYNSSAKTLTYPEDYIFVDGDVVRVIGESDLWKIKDADSDYLYMEEDFTFTSGDIEILRPNNTDDIVYNEIRTWKISDGVTDDPLSSYALINYGDSWGEFVYDEDYTASTSLLYENGHDDEGRLIRVTGRPFVERVDLNKTELQNIVFSNKYFDNTSINGLSTFISTNRAELSDENGDIIDLKRVGEVLYAIQRNEITSFYVGKAILKQSSTGEVTADTSQILAGKRESAFDYGSIFQTARMNNYLFGYDIYQGVFWMNSYNGVQPISGKIGSSNYKMDTYFKNKSKALLASGIDNIYVKIGIDKSNETVYVSFIDIADSDNNDTIAYHIPSNRWISRYSFSPEMYAWLDDKFYTLKTGKLYVHDDDTAYKNTFYGTSYESEIKFVSHLAPNMIKLFNAIAIHSDDNWSNEYIQISPSTSYPNGMYTKVLDSEWINEEGAQKYEIPKNMKTRTSVINNYDRINGEDMRGNVIEVKLTNDSKDKVELFKVDVISELSK